MLVSTCEAHLHGEVGSQRQHVVGDLLGQRPDLQREAQMYKGASLLIPDSKEGPTKDNRSRYHPHKLDCDRISMPYRLRPLIRTLELFENELRTFRRLLKGLHLVDFECECDVQDDPRIA